MRLPYCMGYERALSACGFSGLMRILDNLGDIEHLPLALIVTRYV